VVKAYNVTMGTQTKAQLAPGAPSIAILPDRQTDRQALLLPAQQNTPAWEQQGLSCPIQEAS